MAVIGAILGDIAGSQFEFNRPENLDYKHCELFTNRCSYTDDMIMTLAVKKAILADADFTKTMREVGQPYPYSGYGGRFYEWMYGENPKPYNSFGNGSAMRVSFVGEHFDALEDVISMAEKSAEVTHNHPEGIKGAVVTAVCIWMARHGKTKEDIFQYVLEQYPAEKYEYSIAVESLYQVARFGKLQKNMNTALLSLLINWRKYISGTRLVWEVYQQQCAAFTKAIPTRASSAMYSA